MNFAESARANAPNGHYSDFRLKDRTIDRIQRCTPPNRSIRFHCSVLSQRANYCWLPSPQYQKLIHNFASKKVFFGSGRDFFFYVARHFVFDTSVAACAAHLKHWLIFCSTSIFVVCNVAAAAAVATSAADLKRIDKSAEEIVFGTNKNHQQSFVWGFRVFGRYLPFGFLAFGYGYGRSTTPSPVSQTFQKQNEFHDIFIYFCFYFCSPDISFIGVACRRQPDQWFTRKCNHTSWTISQESYVSVERGWFEQF